MAREEIVDLKISDGISRQNPVDVVLLTMGSDSTVMFWLMTLAGFQPKPVCDPDGVDDVTKPEPKVWNNAAELLAQEFRPLPGETALRLQ